MELSEARRKIDQIDGEITKLLMSRFELAEEIGKEKARLKLPLTNPQREQEILANISKGFPSPYKECIIKVYGGIFSASKSLQDVEDV